MKAMPVVLFSLLLALPGARAWAGGDEAAARGQQLYEEGRYAEAEQALREADSLAARGTLAASLAKQKKYTEAETVARAVIADEPTQQLAVAGLGQALVGQKKNAEAVTAMSAAIERDADLAYAYFWRGQACQGLKQMAKMAADYQTFLRLLPEAPEAPAVRAVLASLK